MKCGLVTGVQTCAHPISWEQLSGRDEMEWVNNERQAPDPDAMQEFYRIAEQWVEGNYDVAMPGGESALDVAHRQEVALELILSHQEEENVLVCMHGRAMRILMCRLTGKELREMEIGRASCREEVCQYV